jgi:hypothetical protein
MPDILTLPRWKRPGSFGVRHERQDVPVATEEELLDFANRWRAAGSAEALPALVPSDPVNTESCLIANALNFDCAVDAAGYGDLWEITITGESPLTPEQIAAMSDVAGSQCEDDSWVDDDGQGWYIYSWKLPEHIGNAADAFDRGIRFQHLAS